MESHVKSSYTLSPAQRYRETVPILVRLTCFDHWTTFFALLTTLLRLAPVIGHDCNTCQSAWHFFQDQIGLQFLCKLQAQICANIIFKKSAGDKLVRQLTSEETLKQILSVRGRFSYQSICFGIITDSAVCVLSALLCCGACLPVNLRPSAQNLELYITNDVKSNVEHDTAKGSSSWTVIDNNRVLLYRYRYILSFNEFRIILFTVGWSHLVRVRFSVRLMGV